MREIATGAEKQLTTDGVKDYGYATDNAGWIHSEHAIVVWSPDSKMLATFQQDQRKTGEMYTVSSRIGHPHLETWKYPLVGDKDVTMIERVIIDVDRAKVTRLKMPPDQHRSTLCDNLVCRRRDGRTCSGPPMGRRWRLFLPRAITKWKPCASRMRPPALFAMCSQRRCQPSSKAAMSM